MTGVLESCIPCICYISTICTCFFCTFSETDWFVQEISAIEESFEEGQLPVPLPQIHLWTVISILIHLALCPWILTVK